MDLPLGDLCPTCRQEIRARARRLGRRVGLLATAALGAWLLWRVPPDPTARMVGAAAVLAVYILTRVIVTRVATEFFR